MLPQGCRNFEKQSESSEMTQISLTTFCSPFRQRKLNVLVVISIIIIISHQNHWDKMHLLFFYWHAVTIPQHWAIQKFHCIQAEDNFFSLLVLFGSFLRWSPLMVEGLLPTHHLSLLFSSDISVLCQFGFPYLFLHSCASFCGALYSVGPVPMCFRELYSSPIVFLIKPQTNTHTHIHSGCTRPVFQ